MDFLGGALPNIMFIVGMLAIGLGLGIELKLVPLNKEIDRTGRIGAIFVGATLVIGSIWIYLNPSLTNRSQPPNPVNAAIVQVVAPTAPAAVETSTVARPATAVPPTEAPPVPAIAEPTKAPALVVNVPDLRDMDDKAVQRALQSAGLLPKKVDQCQGSGSDARAKKGRVLCQNPAPGQAVAVGTAVEYVIAKK